MTTPADWLRSQADPVTSDPAPSSLEELFAEEPVDLDTFIMDRKFIGMNGLSEVQRSVLQHAERIYYPDTFDKMASELGGYWGEQVPVTNFLTVMCGKGSGKDMIARLSSLRIAYLLLCLRDPRGYFGMPRDESIHLLNVASTRDQARLAYFEPMTRIVRRGWFKDKCQPMKTVIEWEKGLTAISGSSDAETQEGLNILLGIADEIDAFRTAEEVRRYSGSNARAPLKSAEGIVKMLRTSAVTRFPQTFKNIRISYPRYHGSPIMTLHANAKDSIEKRGDRSRHFAVGPLPSWEFNPLLAQSEFVSIPESPVPVPEELVEDFEGDPAGSRAAYLCLPERTMAPPFFRSVHTVDQALVEAPEIEVFWEFARGAWHAHFVIPRSLQPADGATYAAHADLAVNGDRAGFAVAHVVSWDRYSARDDITGTRETYEQLPVIKVDCAVALEADLSADPPREIQLRAVRQLVFALRQRGFNFASVSVDGFQSVDTRQELEVAGIYAPLLSVDRTEEPYTIFRTVVEDGRAQLPSSRLLRQELLELSQDARTRKIDHAPAGCFVGETRVPLLDGTYPTISELVDRKVWVFSSTDTGQIVPGYARGRLTKYVSELVDVILDNGYVARCTPDHLWMLRNGEYKRAADLESWNDRLMPIGFQHSKGNYPLVVDKHNDKRLVHVLVAEYFAGRKSMAHEVVHHKDHSRFNADPSNVEIIDRKEHSRNHTLMRWQTDKDYGEAVRNGYNKWVNDEERKRQVYAARHMPKTHSLQRTDFTIDSLSSVRDSKTVGEAARRLGVGRNLAVHRLRRAGYESWDDLLTRHGSNHNIRAVIPVRLDSPVPVYDLEVEEWSNFALTGGVLVHNSKDVSDAVCGAVYGAIDAGGAEVTTGEDSAEEFWASAPLAAPIGAEASWQHITTGGW